MSEHDGRSTGPTGGHEALLARLRAMEAAAEQVGTSLDEATTCHELAEFLFRTLCDAVGVDLRTDDGGLSRVAVAGAVRLLPAESDVAPSVRAVDGGHPLSDWAVLAGGVRVHAVSVPLLA
ncbi:protein phosphatase, partial [Streptomyces goshikiensis]